MKTDGWAAPAATLALIAFSACSNGGGTAVTLLDYSASVPAGWEVRPPGNEMRLAEYTVRAPGGADSAEVVVYYFGEGQGGSVQANIDRWSSQFSLPDGGPVTPTTTKLDDASFPTTLVELEGNYGRGMGMGPGRESATAGQALDAAVVETPKGNLYIQLFGDTASVRGGRTAFLEFVTSIRG
jgi:hypothetical protein